MVKKALVELQDILIWLENADFEQPDDDVDDFEEKEIKFPINELKPLASKSSLKPLLLRPVEEGSNITLKSEQLSKCDSDFEKTQKSRPIKRANDLSSSSSDEFYSAMSSRDSLDELESLISMNMKKRNGEMTRTMDVDEDRTP